MAVVAPDSTDAAFLPELRAIARRQGYDNLEDVKTAILETNGAVSIFDKDVTIESRGSSRKS